MADKVVITGPTGALGMALIQKCISEGCEVLAVCHKGSKRNAQIPSNPLVAVVEADLNELDKIDLLGDRGYNIFYHLAWIGTYGDSRNDMQIQIQNIQYTIEAVKLAARLGCHLFVGAGSQAEYGRIEGVLRPDTPVFPENGYGMAKLCAGQMSRIVCGQLGINHIWTRILSIYGPFDRSETMVSSSLRKMLRGERAAFTPGEQIWDFLYCEDAAEALYLLGKWGKAGKVYCIGSGKGKLLKDYILAMHRLSGSKGELAIGALPYAKGQVMHLCADIEDLRSDTGFEPKTDFDKGIQKTIEWIYRYEENQYSNTML